MLENVANLLDSHIEHNSALFSIYLKLRTHLTVIVRLSLDVFFCFLKIIEKQVCFLI